MFLIFVNNYGNVDTGNILVRMYDIRCMVYTKIEHLQTFNHLRNSKFQFSLNVVYFTLVYCSLV